MSTNPIVNLANAKFIDTEKGSHVVMFKFDMSDCQETKGLTLITEQWPSKNRAECCNASGRENSYAPLIVGRVVTISPKNHG